MAKITFTQLNATPAPPSTGQVSIYVEGDVLYLIDSAGVVTPLGVASGITGLTGDVSATGPGTSAATVNLVGGQTAANIAAAVIKVLAAASTNTASTLVLRDAGGNFSASLITGNLSGNATTATSFTGSLSGDVSGTQSSTSINSNVVTNAKLAQMGAATLKGNNTGSSANAQDLSTAQVTAMLTPFVGDAGSGGTQGLVPAPTAGQTESGAFLSASGAFTIPDVSKPRFNDFSLVNQTAGPVGSSKFEDVTIYQMNGDTYAAVATGSTPNTLTIYNITNQASPQLRGSIGLAGSYKVAIGVISGVTYAFVPSSGGSRLYVINVSNPNSLSITGNILISGSPGSLYTCVFSGGYVYISTQNQGLTIVDVGGGTGTPAVPVQIYQEGGGVKSLGSAISGTTLYTTNYQTAAPWTVRYLKTWNVTVPASPVLQNTYTLPANTKPGNLSLDGNLALITDINQNIIHVVDVTTPTAPVWKSSLTPSGTFNSGFTSQAGYKVNNFVYVPSGSHATYGGIIDLFDLSTVTAPVKVSSSYTNVPTSVFGGISVYNGYIFAADYGVAPGTSSTLDIFTTGHENAVFGAGTGSSLALSSLTTSTALVSDANKGVVSSPTTATEIGYVHGVTAPVQTQINTINNVTSIAYAYIFG